MWPFKRNPAREFLEVKYVGCESHDGRRLCGRAMRLQKSNPDLSGPELLRLAYWGTRRAIDNLVQGEGE